MARPKKNIQMKKKNCIMLRLSDPEYELISTYAKEAEIGRASCRERV